MGRELLSLALSDSSFEIVGGCGSPISPSLGKDLGIIVTTLEDPSLQRADLWIDFSSAKATDSHIALARKYRKPLVLGTTGLTPATFEHMQEASQEIPLFYSPNFSLTIALYLQAAAHFSKHLKHNFHMGIVETHHTEKKDIPSGTALAIAQALESSCDEQIPIQSIRTGSCKGKHTLFFECTGERLELTHEAFSRSIFAEGALKAAQFLLYKPAGLYSLKDLST